MEIGVEDTPRTRSGRRNHPQPTDHELVVHGIYRVVWQPIYLGALLVTLGVPIGMSSRIALPSMLLLIPWLVYRMHIEGRLLVEEFGDDYRAHTARTKRLVPLLC